MRLVGGRRAVRRTVGYAGKGGWRKQMLRCNGVDRGMKQGFTGNGADFQLVLNRNKACKAY
ncbi:hypothetical protein E2Q31_18105 [Salmonella enterica subsp. enterica serovar Oranienburg]|uniref:Uncharacterized protein n=2 Tax=Salmonella enterica I TaxID=59201 RepID=A0A5H7HN88_SALON|nr:hypothetical protein [Salmonella enterica subsp. enterica serovar Oranienburg]EAB1740292.1 hypothetical protein [Salmonella enterica]EBG6784410.1 hypothetical protein [Salmonella enterica subsp. enterica]ECS5401741.1 hypothetical protein [Salmonella enterica subsp. enterica serovar Litchfield]EAA1730759.1 hypothetical protein [Salmonella enterica subsp. enterica serovar Oranienburg]